MKLFDTLIAIVNHKCPRCHSGDLFESPIFSFRKLFFMPSSCDKCGQGYYPEPGFYYGAMFISYIVTAFYCLGFVGVCILIFGLGVEASFGLLFISLVVLYVWFYRTARAIWIHVNVKFDPDALTRAVNEGISAPRQSYVNKNF